MAAGASADHTGRDSFISAETEGERLPDFLHTSVGEVASQPAVPYFSGEICPQHSDVCSDFDSGVAGAFSDVAVLENAGARQGKRDFGI